jgi:hypothetical protein
VTEHGTEHASGEQTVAGGGDGEVVIEFIPAEDVPDEHRKDNKVFAPGSQAIVMTSTADPTVRLYFNEAEWQAFTAGAKDGEFDDLLEEEPGEQGE